MVEAARPGERTLKLPEATDEGIYFIGRLRTPWHDRSECPRNANGSDAVCTVEIDARFADALTGVEAASHLILLYWMHAARRDLAVQVPRHHGRPRGTFSVRSPARPNPIALSVVRLVGRDGPNLKVVGLDCLDGTALLDIKPYLPSVDSRPDAIVAPGV
jgi:tRNA-Thr(GGU) m(6)t(6)A37 methyltransferase TsaA